MAKKDKNKKPQVENIPDGMKKEDYADAAFRKKVTIIMGSVLLVFVIGVVGALIGAWVKTEKHNQEFEAQQQAFETEKNAVLSQLQAIDANGGSFEDRAEVKIQVTDENFSDWIATLDATYQLPKDDEGYAAYKGATIEIEGLFTTREFTGGAIQYWVYRYHSHDGDDVAHEHDHDGENAKAEQIPIEVIFLDDKADIPEEGAWVKATGVVGPDSTKNLSAVRNAVVTVMDEKGEEHIH